MPLSPICVVADGVGPYLPTTNGVDVTPGNTISIKLNDPTGATTWFLSVFGTDELSTSPTLTNVNPITGQVTATTSIVTFTFPNAKGRAIGFTSTVVGVGSATTTFGTYSVTPNGDRVGSTGETREGNLNYGWAAVVNPLVRAGSNRIVANVAALIPLHGQEGAEVYVTSVESPWTYVTNGASFTIDHIKYEATADGGNTRWVRKVEASAVWLQLISVAGVVYIDPVAGNDENVGTLLAAPLKTYAEFVRRTGASPLSSSTGISIHWLNDQPNNTDPVDLFQHFHNTSFFMDGVLIQVDTGTFGAVTNINRASNITTTAFNANGAAPLNYWTQYLGFLVHDTTNDTWFCVDRDLGNRQAQFTAPYVGAASGLNFTNVPGTITAGHSYVIYRFPKVYVGTVAQHIYGEDLIGSPLAVLAQFTHLHFVSNGINQKMGPQFSFDSVFYADIQECLFDGLAKIEGSVWEQTFVYNCYFLNGFFARETTFLGGGSNLNVDIGSETALDGDIMIHSDMEIQGNVSVGAAWIFDERPGHGFVDVPLWGEAAPDGGSLTLGNALFGTAALWGGSQLRVRPNGKVILGVGVTATNGLLNTGGILIDGSSTGAKITPGFPRVVTDGVAITPANIDSTVGGHAAGIWSSFTEGVGIFPFIPSVGTSALLQADWYVDYVAGNDSNPGTIGSPVKTIMGGIVPKWGTNAPTLSQDTTIHVLTPQTVGAEKIILKPTMLNRSSFAIFGTRVLVTNATLGVVTARNRAAHQEWQAAGFTGRTVGQLVVNHTRGESYAIIRAIAGDIATLYQPLSPLVRNTANVYDPQPSEIDTWVAGDSISIYNLPLVNLLHLHGEGPEQNVAETTGGYIWIENIYVPDPSGTPGYNYLPIEYLGGEFLTQGCWFDGYVLTQSLGSSGTFVGTHFGGGGLIRGCWFIGGGCASPIQVVEYAMVDGDFVCGGGGLFINGWAMLGLVCAPADGRVFLHPNTSVEIRQAILPPIGFVWGAGNVTLQANSSVIRRSPTASWVACLNVALLTFPNAVSIGSAYNVGVLSDGIALTSANLDLYHGLQDARSNARFSEDLSAPSTTLYTVPNIAALPTLAVNDGQAVFVQSVMAPWRFVASGSTLTVDHITVEATSLGGNTRWARDTSYSHPIWRTGVADVYIDSVAGNDENQGIYYTATPPGSPAPLKTAQELRRRWGMRQILTPAGADSAFPGVFVFINVHIKNPIAGPDRLDLIWISGKDCFVRILGENTSTLHSGTLDATAGFTPMNQSGALAGTVNVTATSPNITFSTAQTLLAGTKLVFASQPGTTYTLSANVVSSTAGVLTGNYTGASAPATTTTVPGGLPNIIKDTTSGVTWSSYIGKRIYFSRVNSWAYVLKDLSNGFARISVPQFGNEPAFNPVPATTNPANSDTYIIEDPVHVSLGQLDIDGVSDQTGVDGNYTANNVSNITFTIGSVNGTLPLGRATSRAPLEFYQCLFEGVVGHSPDSNALFCNCRAWAIGDEGLVRTHVPGNWGWSGGALIYPGAVSYNVFSSGGAGDTGALDNDVTVQSGCVILRGNVSVRSFSVWDATVFGDNVDGHAILIGTRGHHGTMANASINGRGSAMIFGSGNAGAGLFVAAGSKVTWELAGPFGTSPPGITGTLGDFRLGSGGVARFFNESTGLPSAIIAETWANLTTAQPTGFGGVAHDFSEDAHLMQR